MRFLLLLLLLSVCSVGPGLFFARRLRLDPLEKLSVSVGLSLVLVYLASFATYLLGVGRWSALLVTFVCLLLTLASRSELAGLVRSWRVRQVLGGFCFLFVWSLALLALVRSYSGGRWVVDWLEHYQRSCFFLVGAPLDFRFVSGALLPARPPLANLVCAHYLRQVGVSFELHQVLLLFLGLLAFFPLCLVMRALTPGRGGRSVLWLTGLLALNPLFIQNLTYAWTKLPACFFVLLAVWLYLSGWRKDDARRVVLAFLSLAAATLVHYSAGPYLLVVAGHYLVLIARGRRRGREALLGAALAGVLLSTWFAWSLSAYANQGTQASHRAVQKFSEQSLSANLGIAAGNAVTSVVPPPLRPSSRTFAETFRQESRAGLVRDYAFLSYQQTLVAAMGSVGGLVVLWLLGGFLCFGRGGARGSRADELWFWRLFVPGCFLIGVGVVSESSLPYGGHAHLSLQPLALLGLALLAAEQHTLPRVLRGLVVLGCGIDVALGIALHVFVQSAVPVAALSLWAQMNEKIKLGFEVSLVGDHLGGLSTVIGVLVLAAAATVIGLLARDVGRGQLSRNA